MHLESFSECFELLLVLGPFFERCVPPLFTLPISLIQFLEEIAPGFTSDFVGNTGQRFVDEVDLKSFSGKNKKKYAQ